MDQSSILIVCTGNICRSPMAEGFLKAKFKKFKLDYSVSSAGLITQGRTPPSEAIEAMSRYGIDITKHVSRLVESIDLDNFDLILGMAKEHVREVAIINKDKLNCSFTIKEFVKRAYTVGPKRESEPIEDWLKLVGHGRSTSDLLGADLRLDVVDPFDKGGDAFHDVATELDSLTTEVVNFLRDVPPVN